MTEKQPEALRLADLQDVGYFKELHNTANELRRLHAMEADALRYRAIRGGLEVDPDNSGIVVSLIDDFGGETLRDEIADAAIDAAITKAEATK